MGVPALQAGVVLTVNWRGQNESTYYVLCLKNGVFTEVLTGRD